MKRVHIIAQALILLLFVTPIRTIDPQSIDPGAPAEGEIVDDVYVNRRFGFSIDVSDIGWETSYQSNDVGVWVTIEEATGPMFEIAIFVTPKEEAPAQTETELLRMMMSEVTFQGPEIDFDERVQIVVRGIPARQYHYVTGGIDGPDTSGFFDIYLSSIEDYWFVVAFGFEQSEISETLPEEFWTRLRFDES